MPKPGRTISRLLLAALLFSLALSGCRKKERELPAPRVQGEASKDLRYAGYVFGGPEVLDFGVQPLSMPESSVSELVSRDKILGARLQATHHILHSFPFQNGRDIRHFIAKGNLEAGILGDMPAIAAAARGDVVIVAMVKHGFSSIVARKPMLVKELKGKRVATGLGSTAHFTLLNALENEGLTEHDIKLVGMDVSDMAQALADGKIDAFSAWEPTPSLALAAHPGFRLVHKGVSFGFLCLRREFAANHPAQAREIAAAVARACLWMRLPGSIEKLAGWARESASSFQRKPYPLKAAQMIEITRHDLLEIPIAPQIPERLLREHEMLWKEFDFLRKTGNIPAATPWEKIRGSVDTGLLRAVMSDSKRYGLEQFDYRYQKQADGTP